MYRRSSAPPTCSWEEKYNFTPTIRHYPGVKGVVRNTWWKAAKKKNTDPISGAEKKEKGPEKDNSAVAESVKEEKNHAILRPSAPRKPRSSKPRPTTSSLRGKPSNTSSSEAEKTTTEKKKEEEAESNNASTLKVFTEAREKSIQSRYKRNYKPPPSPQRVEAYEKIAQERASRLEQYSHPAQGLGSNGTISKVKPTRPKWSYQPRVKGNYTLPSSFAREVMQAERHRHPCILPQGPAVRQTQPPPTGSLFYNSQYRQHNRRQFLEELAQGNPSVMTPTLVTKYCSTPQDAGYDYNFITTDAIEEAWERRLLSLYETQDALYNHFVAGVEPLADALRTTKEAVSGTGSPVWVVRDDGHVSSPIELQPAGQGELAGYYDDVYEDEVALLVHPFPDEVSTIPERVFNESERVVSKGREWDRQYAIRAAVGTTAQETLLDLEVDPRYRLPGQLLLKRNGRTFRG